MRFSRFRLALATALIAPHFVFAAVIGQNVAAQPVTAERIATLPKAEQPAWREYLARSQRLHEADIAFFQAELKQNNISTPTTPREGRGSGLSLNHPADWFAGPEARTIADNVLSYQTPAGGWSKNMNFTAGPRKPGERFAPGNAAPASVAQASGKAGDFDTPADTGWHYVGTFDNNATITQLRFLARVASAQPAEAASRYRAAVLRGLEYALAAQFPNGGWPQVFPLEGGYHDSITFNDDALVNVITFFKEMSSGEGAAAIVPPELRTRMQKAIARAIDCILACQVKSGGKLLAWGQQHDAFTLQPASARNYEMPSLASGESAGIAKFLMTLPAPSPAVVAAVHAAVDWFRATELRDVAFRPAADGSGRTLVPTPGARSLWARYYEIGTNRPLFGDRDKTVHNDINDISRERRNGYAWFGTGPNTALEHYEKWSKAHPRAGS